MCGLNGLRGIGIVTAVFATLVSMGTEGFYAWKAYEIDHVCSTYQNESDVCIYNDLQVRTYIGLAEGIVGTIVSITLIIGFASVYLPLVWIWVVWALGISSYNAYCIHEYYMNILNGIADEDYVYEALDTTMSTEPASPIPTEPGESTFPWGDFVGLDYSFFFITVMSSVCCHVFILLIVIPVAVAITCAIGPDSGTVGSYELVDRERGEVQLK